MGNRKEKHLMPFLDLLPIAYNPLPVTQTKEKNPWTL